uniref:HTH CENPB-type domain-containing protein n=1 Tax=Amphimedon queenslandica TaxID=400682 RepID=A0A1X7UXH6_AMPQE
MKKATSSIVTGVHLWFGSGRDHTYPKVVDEGTYEWVLTRRDSHLPVSRDLIKVKASQFVKKYLQNFSASTVWLQKFMSHHDLSLHAKTLISQKLPAQVERQLECFLNEVRIGTLSIRSYY